jgi:Protein of unknwon function (DUF3310)
MNDVDYVNHPPHYKQRCIECLDATRGMGFTLGNCVKYVYRAPYKGNIQQDLEKARFYLVDHRNYRQSHMLQPSSQATHGCRLLAAESRQRASTDKGMANYHKADAVFFYAISDGDYGIAADAIELLIAEVLEQD